MFHRVGCDATGGIVVGGHGRGRLWMPHFFEGDAQGAGFLAVVKERAEFSLGSAGEDFVHDVTENMDGAVWFEGGGRGGGGCVC